MTQAMVFGVSSSSDTARPRALASPDMGHVHAYEVRLRSMFDAEYDFIWRALRRLGLDEGAADDAAQETFVVAAKKLEKIDLGRERSFLLGTAIRLAANVRRTRAFRDRRDVARAQPSSDDSSQDLTKKIVDASPLPDERAAQREQLERLDRALDSLPDELREIVVLTELDALPQPEIATLLGLPVGTVASRLRRARRDLANAMKDESEASS